MGRVRFAGRDGHAADGSRDGQHSRRNLDDWAAGLSPAFLESVMERARDHERIRLLLVDEDPRSARLIHEMLGQTGSPPFEVTHVERLQAAVQHLARRETDVLVLDLSPVDAPGAGSPGRAGLIGSRSLHRRHRTGRAARETAGWPS